MNDSISFLLNGNPVVVNDVPVTLSLLNWLRINKQLTGTKEGCAEGDCGACTVAIASLDADDQMNLVTINACIQFVAALDGKAVFTVEYLRKQAGGGLHPTQQAMVDCHGSQCGFCTPGFVMSLWTLYHNHESTKTVPDAPEISSALTGNLCRCTGYRPIIEAGKKMFSSPQLPLDRDALCDALRALQRGTPLSYQFGGQNFHAPKTVEQLLELRDANPTATLLAGCTDIGLWVNKQFRPLHDLIYVGQVDALRTVAEADGKLVIGAGVTLTEAFSALTKRIPALAEMWERFASQPVRNAGTLGGNVANGSPIGDSMPGLIALGASVVLRSKRGERYLPLEDLYLDYMKKDLAPDEVVASIEVPLPDPAFKFRTYKISKRFDSDISAVCAAFSFRLIDGIVSGARVAFGGMAATPKRGIETELALNGRPLDASTLALAREAIGRDYAPLTDMRASADYRLRVARNLLDRLFAETRLDDALPANATSVFSLTTIDS